MTLSWKQSIALLVLYPMVTRKRQLPVLLPKSFTSIPNAATFYLPKETPDTRQTNLALRLVDTPCLALQPEKRLKLKMRFRLTRIPAGCWSAWQLRSSIRSLFFLLARLVLARQQPSNTLQTTSTKSLYRSTFHSRAKLAICWVASTARCRSGVVARPWRASSSSSAEAPAT